MAGNDFQTDTRKPGKKEFLHRMGGVFTAALFLTGLYSATGLYFFVRSFSTHPWEEIGAAGFAWKCLTYLTAICVLVSLVKIALDEKPFSRTLAVCVRLIGGMFLAASVVIPHLSGYTFSGFAIGKAGSFVLADGMILLPGLLLLLLGSLIQAGFDTQKEMDEIL
ncbi:MAG: hypothetical protein Q4F41_10795 [Eubacteriales bacterium]|nr:hypothetical protein [Eubacteriales bacterium]